MVHHKKIVALPLIGIAIIGLLYYLDIVSVRIIATNLSGPFSAPNSPGQRNSTASYRSLSLPVEARDGCVNYKKFTPKSKFSWSTRVTSARIFRTVKRLVFFIGHSKSGSSTIGRLLDAHPHVIISNEVHSCVYLNFV